MNTARNLIWLIFGGLFSALCYLVGGIALCLTITSIPFGIQCFKLAQFVLWPFGRMAVGTSSNSGCISLPIEYCLDYMRRGMAGYWTHRFRLVVGHHHYWIAICTPAF